jgi:nucleoid-associated protein YgaU
MDGAATSTDGARRLATAIDDSDDTVLDNFAGLFGKDYSTDSQASAFRSVRGSGPFSDFTSNLGRVSGLSLRNITSLLGVLVPVIFSVIKRTLRSRNLKSADIGSLLAGQRANIAAALPTGMSRRFAEEPYTIPREASRARRAEVAEPESSAGRWILPLAGVLAAIGLLWYLASRPTMPVRDARTVTEQRIPGADLARKYQSVINEARAQGVQISSVRQQDGKLMLKGTAPNQEAINKVWNEITRVNPKHDDIVADFSVATSAADIEKDKTAKVHDEQAPTVARQKPSDGTTPSMADKDKAPVVTRDKPSDDTFRTYTVKRGDTLGSISRQFYGNTHNYTKIFEANRDRIKNPNVIEVGEQLMIPE